MKTQSLVDIPPTPSGRCPSGGHFWIWFVLILLLKWHTLGDPPVWDAAVGLYPAAGELVDNGFDLPQLLQQPTLSAGGPNCHADSGVTWLTAGVLWSLGKGQSALVVLHLLHFAMTAWTMAVLLRLALQSYDRLIAWLLCVVVLLCPLFHVQAGMIYFEIPLALCTVSAVAAYANGQFHWALFWSTLAVMVKQTGIVVAGALSAAALLRNGSLWQRLVRALLYAVAGFGGIYLPLLGSPVLKGLTLNSRWNGWWEWLTLGQLPWIKPIPDVVALCLLFMVISVFQIRDVLRSLISAGQPVSPLREDDAELPQLTSGQRVPTSAWGVSVLLVPMLTILLFVAPYVANLNILALPRYAASILPCVWFGMVYGVLKYIPARYVAAGLVAVAMLFVANKEGAIYPTRPGNNLSEHERSEEYRRILKVQVDVMQMVSKMPDDTVIYYGIPEHYFMKYPWMGYVNRSHPGGRCVSIANERPRSWQSGDLPEQFFIVFDDRGFWGGGEVREILKNVVADPDRKVIRYRRFQQGESVIDIVKVRPAAVVPG